MKVVACIGWLSTDVFLSRTATAGAFAIYTKLTVESLALENQSQLQEPV